MDRCPTCGELVVFQDGGSGLTRQEEASIAASDGTELSATLDIPADGIGGLVVLHGAEMPERHFFLYQHLGNVLPEQGWAVLRYDRRASDGTLPLAQQSEDALAAVDALRSKLSPGAVIGLWGFSQGAWAAIEAAADGNAVDLVVLVGFSAVSPAEQMRHATTNFLRDNGFDETAVEQLLVTRDAVDAYLRGDRSRREAQSLLDQAREQPWFHLAYLPDQLPVGDEFREAADFMFFDPTTRLAHVDVPVLALYGDRDDHVPVDDCVTALRNTRSKQVTVEVLDGVGHFLTHHDRHEASELHDEYVPRLMDWLRTVAAGRHST